MKRHAICELTVSVQEDGILVFRRTRIAYGTDVAQAIKAMMSTLSHLATNAITGSTTDRRAAKKKSRPSRKRSKNTRSGSGKTNS